MSSTYERKIHCVCMLRRRGDTDLRMHVSSYKCWSYATRLPTLQSHTQEIIMILRGFTVLCLFFHVAFLPHIDGGRVWLLPTGGSGSAALLKKVKERQPFQGHLLPPSPGYRLRSMEWNSLGFHQFRIGYVNGAILHLGFRPASETLVRTLIQT